MKFLELAWQWLQAQALTISVITFVIGVALIAFLRFEISLNFKLIFNGGIQPDKNTGPATQGDNEQSATMDVEPGQNGGARC